MGYRLSRKAEDDLIAIYSAGVQAFGAVQADRYHAGLTDAFRFLAEFPYATRERAEIRPPVRIHPHKAHLIVYAIRGGDILIIRVRHEHEDWAEFGSA